MSTVAYLNPLWRLQGPQLSHPYFHEGFLCPDTTHTPTLTLRSSLSLIFSRKKPWPQASCESWPSLLPIFAAHTQSFICSTNTD